MEFMGCTSRKHFSGSWMKAVHTLCYGGGGGHNEYKRPVKPKKELIRKTNSKTRFVLLHLASHWLRRFLQISLHHARLST